MNKKATVSAKHSRAAVATAARELGLPRGYKVKGSPKFNSRTKKWTVEFK